MTQSQDEGGKILGARLEGAVSQAQSRTVEDEAAAEGGGET